MIYECIGLPVKVNQQEWLLGGLEGVMKIGRADYHHVESVMRLPLVTSLSWFFIADFLAANH